MENSTPNTYTPQNFSKGANSVLSITCLTLLLCILPFSMLAQSRMQTAQDFLQSSSSLKSASDVYLKYESTGEVTTRVAVFESENNGFVFIAGDDEQHKVVGYVDNGKFNYYQAPEALVAILSWYEEIPISQSHALLKSGSSYTPIAPMLDQRGIALNQFLHPETGNCATGCAATAFLQIMAYHQYPAKGKGSHCYNHPVIGQLCTDMENSYYNWNTMTEDDYEALSLQLGIAMEMQYCLSYEMIGSAPGRPNYEWVMQNNFGYHMHMSSTQSWYMQNELEQERPIYVVIPGKSAYHAVVVDGMDSDGRFHVNFGWGGAYNGYFDFLSSDTILTGNKEFFANVAQAVYLSPEPITVNETDSLALLAINEAFGGALDWDLQLPVIRWPGVLVMNGRVVGLKIDRYNDPFEGYLPEELGQLSELRTLYVTGKLHGTLPDALYDLPQLRELTLDAVYGSTLKGQLSEKLVQLQKLESIDISHLLEGPLPEALGQLGNLREIYLYDNNLSGTLPTSITNLSKLRSLTISSCGIEGGLPIDIGRLSALQSIYLNGNRLEGPLPESLGELTGLIGLDLANNRFSGEIPASLGNCRELLGLDLQNNLLEGAIPPELGALSRLSRLPFQDNQFSSLPNEIGQIQGLTNINLNNNQLTSLPEGLQQLSGLKILQAANNAIATLPTNFGAWRDLKVLNLSHNRLTVFPEELCNLRKLEELDLSHNRIERLPAGVDGFRVPALLKLNNNELSDNIPLAFLQGDHTLFMGWNRLRYENIPEGDAYQQGLGNQKEALLRDSLFKVPAGESIHIDIRELTGMDHPGNRYYWMKYPEQWDYTFHNEDFFKNESPVLTIEMSEGDKAQRYYCKIFNDEAPRYDWEFQGNPERSPLLNYLNTQAITVLPMTEQEQLEASYPESVVLDLQQIPNASLNDRRVVLVPPFSTRGDIAWEASVDGTTWYRIDGQMSQNDLAVNVVSYSSTQLVLEPMTTAWYRCVLEENDCDPLYGTPLKVSSLGQTLFDEIVNVDLEDFTVEVDSIEVTLPKGLSQGDFRLVITKLENPPAAPEGHRMGSVYDLTVSFGSVFTLPLEIKLKNIDVEGIDDKDIPNYRPVYYNEAEQKWEAYNEGGLIMGKNELYFKTFHLTKLGWWEIQHGSYTHSFENDRVKVIYRYKPHSKEDGQYHAYYLLNIAKGGTKPWHDSNTDPDQDGTPYLVQDVAHYMKEIMDAFEGAGLPYMGLRKFIVYVGDTGSGIVNRILGSGDALGYITMSGYAEGYFYLNSSYAYETDDVRRTLAHEYMHYTQHGYFNVVAGNYFFAEAHAPLADRLVWTADEMEDTEPELNLMGALTSTKNGLSIYDLLGTSWDAGTASLFSLAEKFTINSADANTSSAFLHYMRSYRNGTPLNVAKILREHLLSLGIITNWSWRTYLNSQIQSDLGSTIGKEYDAWVRYLLEGKNENFTIINTAGGNPFTPLISNAGSEKKGTFATHASWLFTSGDDVPREEVLQFTVPHLASRVVLLHNQTADRSLVVNYERRDEKNPEEMVYYGWWDHEAKRMVFEDLSDSTNYAVILDARTEEAEKNFQHMALLLFVNQKCPDVVALSANFSADIKLTATPVINIDALLYANVSDQAIHHYDDGSKGAFIVTGRMDIWRNLTLSYAWELNDYNRTKRMLNDSTVVIETSFNERIDITNGKALPNTINEWKKRQSIFYNLITGRMEIMQSTETTSSWGAYYDYENVPHAANTYRRTEEMHHMVVEDVFNFITGPISNISDKAHSYETTGTYHTQSTLKKLEHTITDFSLESNGTVTETMTKTLTGTDYPAQDVKVTLWFTCE